MYGVDTILSILGTDLNARPLAEMSRFFQRTTKKQMKDMYLEMEIETVY